MKLSKDKKSSLNMGMLLIFLLSLALHFWGLNRFNSLVFDEVYYVKYAQNYLSNTPLFDAHPPLGKYMIAISIWVGKYFPFGQDPVNNLTGVELSPFTYRWLNALVGSLLPLVVGGIAYQLSHRRSYAIIAALFTACDGLFLVESRYALINIYLIFFGLLGQWFFLIALEQSKGRWFWLVISGICLGAAAGVKWNGLAFLLGTYLIWIGAWLIRLLPNHLGNQETERPPGKSKLIYANFSLSAKESPLQNLTSINLLQVIFYFGAIPAIVYYLIWIPHLQINNNVDFWELHQQILGFHQRMKNTSDVHPYCSNWYTWPLMIRPIAYFYETVTSNNPAKPSLPTIPSGMEKVIYDVHAMGNPALWWLSTLAILILVIELMIRVLVWLKKLAKIDNHIVYFPQPKELWCIFYLIVNYAANLLPWVKVTRCTFLYLYMGAVIFSFMGLAWLVERWLHSDRVQNRRMGLTTILVILVAFVFWLPVYLGLPLSPESLQIRMWFRSWI
ncbi:MAG TPA: phospholipid carrier-dependent glycosyltransferase [Leptolyngbyaceae cyanobacterium]